MKLNSPLAGLNYRKPIALKFIDNQQIEVIDRWNENCAQFKNRFFARGNF